jgi:hypothetical protein
VRPTCDVTQKGLLETNPAASGEGLGLGLLELGLCSGGRRLLLQRRRMTHAPSRPVLAFQLASAQRQHRRMMIQWHPHT